MKLSFHPYGKGALLRWDEEGSRGYSTIHPLEEWRDPPLEWHLKHLESPLMQRARTFAALDRKGRQAGVNLFEGKTVPKSHFLVTDLSSFQGAKGSPRVKVKVGRKPKSEIARLHEWIPILEEERLLLRLDFNNRLTHEQFRSYMGELKLLHSFIEFIEDPFPYDEEAWEEEMAFWRCKFALDQDSERGIGKPHSAPILILKPVRQNEEKFKVRGQRIIVTSVLDHPLGQAQAAYVSTQFPPEIGGLNGESGPFEMCPGTGFGFDSLLEKREWFSG